MATIRYEYCQRCGKRQPFGKVRLSGTTSYYEVQIGLWRCRNKAACNARIAKRKITGK